MSKLSIAVILLAAFLPAARLWTGTVFLGDEPTTLLVLKRAPDWTVERTETPDRPASDEIVLDSEEPDLVYGDAYLGLMGATPWLSPLLLTTGLILAQSRRRRPVEPAA